MQGSGELLDMFFNELILANETRQNDKSQADIQSSRLAAKMCVITEHSVLWCCSSL